MQITLFDIDINKDSTSWVTVFEIVCGWRGRALFQIEWTYEKRIKLIDVLFIRFYF